AAVTEANNEKDTQVTETTQEAVSETSSGSDSQQTERGGRSRRGQRSERGDRGQRRGGRADNRDQFLERVIQIHRVAKVVNGGRRFAFTALVVVGAGEGMVAVGYGECKEVPHAIAKPVDEQKTNV